MNQLNKTTNDSDEGGIKDGIKENGDMENNDDDGSNSTMTMLK